MRRRHLRPTSPTPCHPSEKDQLTPCLLKSRTPQATLSTTYIATPPPLNAAPTPPPNTPTPLPPPQKRSVNPFPPQKQTPPGAPGDHSHPTPPPTVPPGPIPTAPPPPPANPLKYAQCLKLSPNRNP